MTPHNRRIYIYVKPIERLLADGERPPVRIDPLMRLDLHGIATLTAIAFSLTELPRFCWDEARGWLELPGIRMPGIFSDAQDFISAIPDIQAWMHEWSESASRAPDLSPSWATARNATAAAVKEFSKGLESQLSRSKSRSLVCCDASGTEAVLNVPAKAMLSLPPAATDGTSVLYIDRTELTLKLVLATGREVLMPIGARSTIATGSAPLLVDPRRLRAKPVTHVKRVWSVSDGLPDEDIE